jgi:hypothetical protein
MSLYLMLHRADVARQLALRPEVLNVVEGVSKV